MKKVLLLALALALGVGSGSWAQTPSMTLYAGTVPVFSPAGGSSQPAKNIFLNMAALRAAQGPVAQQLFVQGTTTLNDGGQGFFFWNILGSSPDDNGVTTIVPSNYAGTGQWTRMVVGGSGSTPSNPTAVAGPNAVNGASLFYMRSDAAPAVQKGSSGQFGIMECDGTKIVCPGGILNLGATTIIPGTYGDSTHVAQTTYDAQGRATNVTPVLISGGGGGGSFTLTDGTRVQTGVTTLSLGNGLCTTNGSSGTAPENLCIAATTKTGSYPVAAGDMSNALNLAATSGTPVLTLPAVSSTIFQPGMTLTFSTASSTVDWTLLNSTGLTLTGLNTTVLPPGTSGTFVANADGTSLNFFPSAQPPTTTALGSIKATNSVAHQWLAYCTTTGICAQSQPAITDISGAGTAAAVNTGTSGHTLPFLDGNNTFSGTDNFTGALQLGGNAVSTAVATQDIATTSGTTVPIAVTTGHARLTGTLVGTLTVPLPAVVGFPSNGLLVVDDASGSASTINTQTIAANGTETINGTASGTFVNNVPHGRIILTAVAGGWNATASTIPGALGTIAFGQGANIAPAWQTPSGDLTCDQTGLCVVGSVTPSGGIGGTHRVPMTADSFAQNSIANKQLDKGRWLVTADATGITSGKLVVASSTTNGDVTIAGASATGVLGVAETTAASGNGSIITAGPITCVADSGGLTRGHFVIPSATAGDCADGGATQPTGVQVLGTVLTGVVGAGNATIFYSPQAYTNTSGGSPTLKYCEAWLTAASTIVGSSNCGTASGGTWTAPSWVTANTHVHMEVLGPGGSGGGCNTVGDIGGVGTPGGLAIAEFDGTITASTGYTFVVGSGGALIAAGTQTAGNNGSASTTIAIAGTTYTGGPGNGGTVCNVGGQIAGGVASNGTFNINGQASYKRNVTDGSMGSAVPLGLGTSGANSGTSALMDGSGFGYGGAGGAATALGSTAGGNGVIRVRLMGS